MTALPVSSVSYGNSALPAAFQWIELLILGPLGNAVAVIAVALIGFAMLSGRVSIRAGVQVAIGFFILFGAPAIARAFLDLARASAQPAPIPVPPPPLPVAPPRPSANTDPYAGASVPM